MWQFGGVAFPLMAGPCRVLAWTIWNTKIGDFSFDTVKAMLYLKYQITTFDKFFGYTINLFVYGNLYKTLGWSSTFKEINFKAKDLVCYDWNNGAPTRKTTNIAGVYDCTTKPLELWV